MTSDIITAKIKVNTIRSENPKGFGGWTFFGKPHDSNDANPHPGYYVEASYKVIGRDVDVCVGDSWQISGKRGTNIISPYGVPINEIMITADDAYLIVPKSHEIKQFLIESKRFKGIGSKTADNLWDAFHEELFEILKEDYVENLSGIKGMSLKKAQNTVEAWEKLVSAAAIQFLTQFELDIKKRRLISQFFGSDCEEKVRKDPWRLLAFSVNFRTIDRIALQKFKIAIDNPFRFEGLIEEALYRDLEAGNTVMMPNQLRWRVKNLLMPSPNEMLRLPISERQKIVRMADTYSHNALSYDNAFQYFKGERYWHPIGLHYMERKIARRLMALREECDIDPKQIHQETRGKITEEIAELGVAEYESREGYDLGFCQRQAVIQSLTNQISIVTGGAGTGKTTILKTIYFVLDKYDIKIIQIALTNRACRKMSELTGRNAYTIYHFIHHLDEKMLRDHPYIVIDEASMLDVILMFGIFEKMPHGCHLIIVGDPVQLPPIGPGLILPFLTDPEKFPVVELEFIYRQSESTGIPAISNQIRNHEWPDMTAYFGKGLGVSILQCDERHITDAVLDIYDELGGPSPKADVQILTLVKVEKYPDSSERINYEVHLKYFAKNEEITYWDFDSKQFYRSKFCVEDKVMFVTKNYRSRGLLNGTLGYIVEALNPFPDVMYEDDVLLYLEENSNQSDLHVVKVNFDSGLKRLLISDLECLDYGYAFTVHKAQGSQFKRVIIPILNHPRMLDHAMVYTALTRAEKQCVFVGDIEALKKAVKSPAKMTRRKTGLEQMINDFPPILSETMTVG